MNTSERSSSVERKMITRGRSTSARGAAEPRAAAAWLVSLHGIRYAPARTTPRAARVPDRQPGEHHEREERRDRRLEPEPGRDHVDAGPHEHRHGKERHRAALPPQVPDGLPETGSEHAEEERTADDPQIDHHPDQLVMRAADDPPLRPRDLEDVRGLPEAVIAVPQDRPAGDVRQEVLKQLRPTGHAHQVVGGGTSERGP